MTKPKIYISYEGPEFYRYGSLAKQAEISPAIIQDIRSGKRDNLTLKTFASLIDALGYNLVLENRKKIKGLPTRIKINKIGGRKIKQQKCTT